VTCEPSQGEENKVENIYGNNAVFGIYVNNSSYYKTYVYISVKPIPYISGDYLVS